VHSLESLLIACGWGVTGEGASPWVKGGVVFVDGHGEAVDERVKEVVGVLKGKMSERVGGNGQRETREVLVLGCGRGKDLRLLLREER